ncbi:hypothetical protein J6590_030970 [Homalodisca vitripennis]|nr:hypothetical protein J6590_030970 [Homalodisca vitripennis]
MSTTVEPWGVCNNCCIFYLTKEQCGLMSQKLTTVNTVSAAKLWLLREKETSNLVALAVNLGSLTPDRNCGTTQTTTVYSFSSSCSLSASAF